MYSHHTTNRDLFKNTKSPINDGGKIYPRDNFVKVKLNCFLGNTSYGNQFDNPSDGTSGMIKP